MMWICCIHEGARGRYDFFHLFGDYVCIDDPLDASCKDSEGVVPSGTLQCVY